MELERGQKFFSFEKGEKPFLSKYHHRERPIITELKIRVNCSQFPNSSSGVQWDEMG